MPHMNPYATSFLLFLYQLSLGGLFALSVTPFFELERGFYKTTTAVLVFTAVLAFWGQLDLVPKNAWVAYYASLILLGTFTTFLVFYFILLWGERGFLRARCYALALLTGLAGLIVSSLLATRSPLGVLEVLLLPITSVLSAVLLGAVTVGMLIGHWYLIDTGQSLEPFYRVFKFFVATLIIQAIVQWIAALLLYFFGTPETVSSLERILNDHAMLISARFLVPFVHISSRLGCPGAFTNGTGSLNIGGYRLGQRQALGLLAPLTYSSTRGRPAAHHRTPRASPSNPLADPCSLLN